MENSNEVLNFPRKTTNKSGVTITSADSKFMGRLIDWLASQQCEPNTTIIRVHDRDPYEEIDNMTRRILELETEWKKFGDRWE